jgi:hypothetical protein
VPEQTAQYTADDRSEYIVAAALWRGNGVALLALFGDALDNRRGRHDLRGVDKVAGSVGAAGAPQHKDEDGYRFHFHDTLLGKFIAFIKTLQPPNRAQSYKLLHTSATEPLALDWCESGVESPKMVRVPQVTYLAVIFNQLI